MKSKLPGVHSIKVTMSTPSHCGVCVAFLHFQKGDKWTKMMGQEENLVMVNEFLEKGDERVLVIALTPQGQLCPATTFPASSKTKVCVFSPLCVRK